MSRTNLWRDDELSERERRRLRDLPPDELPEPARSRSARVGGDRARDRILAAICRPSGPGAARQAERVLRQDHEEAEREAHELAQDRSGTRELRAWPTAPRVGRSGRVVRMRDGEGAA